MPSGLTSMSSGSSGACRMAAASGAKADVPSPWYDCVQSIGAPLVLVRSLSPRLGERMEGAGWEGASGRGVPETAGTGFRGMVVGFDGVGGCEGVVLGAVVVEAAAALVAVDGCAYCFALEALTRVRQGNWDQHWGLGDWHKRRDVVRRGVSVREAIV